MGRYRQPIQPTRSLRAIACGFFGSTGVLGLTVAVMLGIAGNAAPVWATAIPVSMRGPLGCSSAAQLEVKAGGDVLGSVVKV